MDACLVLRQGAASAYPCSLCNALQKFGPVVFWASAELPDLMPWCICQKLQVIHTALYNHLKLLKSFQAKFSFHPLSE
jgi:hypothetical protein